MCNNTQYCPRRDEKREKDGKRRRRYSWRLVFTSGETKILIVRRNNYEAKLGIPDGNFPALENRERARSLLLFNFRLQETRQRTPVEKFRAVNSRHSTGFSIHPGATTPPWKGIRVFRRWKQMDGISLSFYQAGIIFVDCGRRRRRKLVVGRIGGTKGMNFSWKMNVDESLAFASSAKPPRRSEMC